MGGTNLTAGVAPCPKVVHIRMALDGGVNFGVAWLFCVSQSVHAKLSCSHQRALAWMGER